MANRKWKMEKAWQFAISHLPFPIRPGFFSGLLDGRLADRRAHVRCYTVPFSALLVGMTPFQLMTVWIWCLVAAIVLIWFLTRTRHH
jgi:hypothetical protein